MIIYQYQKDSHVSTRGRGQYILCLCCTSIWDIGYPNMHIQGTLLHVITDGRSKPQRGEKKQIRIWWAQHKTLPQNAFSSLSLSHVLGHPLAVKDGSQCEGPSPSFTRKSQPQPLLVRGTPSPALACLDEKAPQMDASR